MDNNINLERKADAAAVIILFYLSSAVCAFFAALTVFNALFQSFSLTPSACTFLSFAWFTQAWFTAVIFAESE